MQSRTDHFVVLVSLGVNFSVGVKRVPSTSSIGSHVWKSYTAWFDFAALINGTNYILLHYGSKASLHMVASLPQMNCN
jgi:hypothetical protein